VGFEAIGNLLVGRARGGRLIYDDNIETRQQYLMLAK
jgi:hypothetical protein